ncbi:MAG: cysteine synthase family protein, partial [Desulfobulbaceae bacterium]|nr:cysteine synthase family protein [Desulfobulbaceae bacterium]
GIMVGPTTGALLHAVRQLENPTGKAVLISADNAAKYVSTYSKYL